jgi:hypothetical protein
MFVIRDYCFYVMSFKSFHNVRHWFGRPGLSTVCISYLHRIRPYSVTDRQDGSGSYMIVNPHPLMRLLNLWFESIPCIVQGTKNTISNHPLFQCSVFNIKL